MNLFNWKFFMSVPFPFLLGNRSEYLAIPALTKLGFTVPVPGAVLLGRIGLSCAGWMLKRRKK